MEKVYALLTMRSVGLMCAGKCTSGSLNTFNADTLGVPSCIHAAVMCVLWVPHPSGPTHRLARTASATCAALEHDKVTFVVGSSVADRKPAPHPNRMGLVF